jgi:CelD/BcsL family acetyltransferase involved in cellulose biosynthesis
MKVSAIPAQNLTGDLIDRWSRFQEEDPALKNPVFRPELIQAYASIRDNLEVAIVEDADEVVGFLPFVRAQQGVGGPHPFADYQGVIARRGVALDARELVKGCGLAAWDFDRVLASQALFQPFHKRLAPSALIDLSKGYETYAAERRAAGSEQIKKSGNLMRRLEREVGPLRFEAHVSSEPILRQLVHWSDKKQGRDSGEVPSSEPTWVYRVLEKVLFTQKERFCGMLSVLYAGEELVAAHFGMRSGTYLYSWWPGYNPHFEKYSPGIILMLKIAEASSLLGLRFIDLGLVNQWQYKQRLMNTEITVAAGSVEVPSLLTAMRRLRGLPRTMLNRVPALRDLARKGAHVLRGDNKPHGA